MSVQQFSQQDVTEWYQAEDKPIFLGDIVDAANSKSMTIGFCRYRKGASNDWVVTYDEALVVTKGVFSVIGPEGKQTAAAGEVIFLTKGTKLTYMAEEDAEVVYVSYPHWAEAQRASEHAHLLDTFHPVDRSIALGES